MTVYNLTLEVAGGNQAVTMPELVLGLTGIDALVQAEHDPKTGQINIEVTGAGGDPYAVLELLQAAHRLVQQALENEKAKTSESWTVPFTVVKDQEASTDG